MLQVPPPRTASNRIDLLRERNVTRSHGVGVQPSRHWRKRLAKQVECNRAQSDVDVLVPVPQIGQTSDVALEFTIDDLAQHAMLATESRINRPCGHARGTCNRIDTNLGESPIEKQIFGHVEQGIVAFVYPA